MLVSDPEKHERFRLGSFFSTMSTTTVPLHASPVEVVSAGGYGLRKQNLTLDDIKSDSISTIAEKHWSGKKIQWSAKTVETIVEKELKPNQYDPRKLMLLEYTQYLEKVNKKQNLASDLRLQRLTQSARSRVCSIFGLTLTRKRRPSTTFFRYVF